MMKAGRAVVAVAGGIAAAAITLGAAAARQGNEEPQAWAAGKCYRVTILDPEQQHTIRVLQPPIGAWVRVQSDPASPRVPGASPGSRVWLNSAAVFTVQEVVCSGPPPE